MTVHVDGPARRRGSQVVWCDECPTYREVRTTRAQALREAGVHAAQVHDQGKVARELRDLAAARERDTPTTTR